MPHTDTDAAPAFAWPPLPVDVEYALHDDAAGGAPPLTATAARAVPRSLLGPLWQVIVLGDGSLTRALGLLTGSPTIVRVLDEVRPYDAASAPPEARALAPPLLRRRVWLGNERGERLAYAVSWWNADEYARLMPCPALPIGTSLSTARLEVDRRIAAVWRARAPGARDVGGDLWAALVAGGSGDVWARCYSMVSGGRPLAVICEVFAPGLSRYLGMPGGDSGDAWRDPSSVVCAHADQ